MDYNRIKIPNINVYQSSTLTLLFSYLIVINVILLSGTILHVGFFSLTFLFSVLICFFVSLYTCFTFKGFYYLFFSFVLLCFVLIINFRISISNVIKDYITFAAIVFVTLISLFLLQALKANFFEVFINIMKVLSKISLL